MIAAGCCLNGTVKEWIAKAEDDFDIAQLAMRAPDRPHYDAVCFHSQQCVEKLMKDLLIHLGVKPPRTHSLAALDELLTQTSPGWTWPPAELRFLTKGAGALRYPGATAERDDAVRATAICTRLREALLKLLQEDEE